MPVLTTPRTLVTRRPVYDDKGGVFGHELVSFDGSPGTGSASTARAVLDGVVSGLLDGLVPGGRLLLPVSADAFDEQLASLLPAERIVVKVPAGTADDPVLAATLADFRARGGLVALGGVRDGDPRHLLLEQADIVAVDLSDPRGVPHAPRAGRAATLPVLGEGIGDPGSFDVARRLGCSYFQGAVFVGTAVARVTPPGFRPAHLALLQAVSRPEVDFAEVEEVTKHDMQLTHACLRYINAAAFGWRRRIDSLAQAFVLLGERGVRRWASLVVMSDLAGDRPHQIAVTAAVRARFCELLGDEIKVGAAPLHLFTLGMFSLFDALTGRPLREALEGLPLDDAVRDALLGHPNQLRALLDVVVAYEAGDWDELGAALQALGADDEHLFEHYLAAVDWSALAFDQAPAGA